MKKLLKVVNKLFFVVFIVCVIFTLINSYNSKNLLNMATALCILPLIMVPFLLDKIKVYHMDEFLVFFYYLLIFLSLVMGGIHKFYYRIGWFDLFVHFISGFFTSIVAFILLEKNKLINKKYKWFGFLFIILFSVNIAVLWEYIEFFCDKLFNCDTQWVFESGVNDTMTDMLIATLSGILSSFYYLYYLKKKIG